MPSDRHHAPIVVTQEGGVRFAAQARSHRVIVDQPLDGGGNDSGPMPLELLGVSLGTCVAYYVQKFLEARGLASQGLRVEAEYATARNPYRVSDFVVRIILPEAVSPAHEEMLERVARSCPVHNTLEPSGAHIRIAIEMPAPAMA
jgi:uncharacterized OsmC-like protein